MARGVTLNNLITRLRAEIGANTNSSVGQQELDQLKQLLQRTQARLYESYDWPFLKARRDITLGVGQRYYDFPADMDFEGIVAVQVKYNGERLPVEFGIDDGHLNQLDSDQTAASGYFDITGGSVGGSNVISSVKVDGLDILGGSVAWVTSNAATATAVVAAINSTISHPEYTAEADGNRVIISAAESEGADANDLAITVTVGGNVTAGTPEDLSGGETGQRSDPAQRWDVIDAGDGEQIEVWPLPATAGMVMRLSGKRALGALVENSDTCDLDGDLIVLMAAAEKRAGQKDGEAKASAATNLLASLRGNSKKSSSFKFGERARERGRHYGVVIRVAGAG